MQHTKLLALLVMATASASAQQMQQRERAFLNEAPRVGEKISDVEIFRPDGSSFNTTDFRGHYTVLTFGCMT